MASDNILDFLTFLLQAIVAFITIYFTWRSLTYLPKWRFEAEYKLDIIKDVFPKFLSDIRKTISEYDSFLKGWASHLTPFQVLKEIIENGKIEYIKNLDETLYNNLWRIEKEILPLLSDLDSEKNNLWKPIRSEWLEYLKSLKDVNFKFDRFIGELWQYVSDSVWIEECDKIIEYATYVFQLLEQQSEEIKRASDGQLKGLCEISEKHVKHVKRNIPQINDLLKEIVEDNVIPSLEKHIADPI